MTDSRICLTRAQVLALWNIVIDEQSDTLFHLVDVDNYGVVTIGSRPFAHQGDTPQRTWRLFTRGGFEEVKTPVAAPAAGPASP